MKHIDNEYYRIVNYLYNHPDLPADLRADLDRWMLAHADDDGARQAMQTLWDENFGCIPRAVDRADLLSFMNKLNSRIDTVRTVPRTTSWPRGFMRYAAAVAVFLVSSVLIFLAGTTMAPETTCLATTDGTVGRYSLPDGTQVILNANSRLTYTSGGIAGNFGRSVKLEGEAFFDVTRDTSHPFSVRTNDATVKVLGTAFDVRAYAASANTEVVLLRGRVAVTPGADGRHGPDVTLSPGEMLTIGRTDGSCTVTGVEAIDYCQWHTPRIKLENKTLRSVLVNIGRRYCLDLDIDPALDLDRRLTLTLTAADNAEQTMAVVSRIAGIDYTITDNKMQIKPNTNHIK